MRSSLIIIGCFVLGVFVGRFNSFDPALIGKITRIVLVLLMACVGMSIGCKPDKLRGMAQMDYRYYLLPLGTIAGTAMGAVVCFMLMGTWRLSDYLAIGSGLGYYSLGSVLISEVRGAELGAVALLTNVFRELLTLLGAPLFVRLFGPLSPIAAGGATTADTTLPIVVQTSGTGYAALSIFHGVLCDLSVPFFVSLFLLF